MQCCSFVARQLGIKFVVNASSVHCKAPLRSRFVWETSLHFITAPVISLLGNFNYEILFINYKCSNYNMRAVTRSVRGEFDHARETFSCRNTILCFRNKICFQETLDNNFIVCQSVFLFLFPGKVRFASKLNLSWLQEASYRL